MDQGMHSSSQPRSGSRALIALSRARGGAPAAGLVLLIVGAVLSAGPTPLWWFGGSLVLSALVESGEGGSPQAASDAARTLAAENPSWWVQATTFGTA